MDRNESLELLKKHVGKANLLKHMYAVEAIMLETADYLKEDKERWAFIGLIHDIDFEKTENSPESHTILAQEMLSGKVDDEAIKIIKTHNFEHTKIMPQEKIEKALKGTFRPEFMNRIDEIIMFSPLSVEQMESIVDLQMKEVLGRLKDYNVIVELSEAARTWLAKQGYDPAFGARPLRRAIQKFVESPLSIELLGGKFTGGGTVKVDVEDDKIVFN